VFDDCFFRGAPDTITLPFGRTLNKDMTSIEKNGASWFFG